RRRAAQLDRAGFVAGTPAWRRRLTNMAELPAIRTLKALRDAEASCTRCPLYKHATQVVPGEGPTRAPIMMVGEQPGDKEDIAGQPFVGPAGRMLDQAIEEAGIDRKKVFVTNAVKHFKFEPRGKRRLHKRPNAYEIERCHWWSTSSARSSGHSSLSRLARPRCAASPGGR